MPAPKDISKEIIEALAREPNGLPFTKLYEKLQNQGGDNYLKQVRSNSTLSEGLKKLIKKGVVYRDIDSRNYKLTEHGVEEMVKLLASNVIESCDNAFTDRLPYCLGEKPRQFLAFKEFPNATYLFIEKDSTSKVQSDTQQNVSKLMNALMFQYGFNHEEKKRFDWWTPVIQETAENEGTDSKTMLKGIKKIVLMLTYEP